MTPSTVPASSRHCPVAALQRRAQGQGKALFFDDTNKGFLGRDVGWYERTQEFRLDFWFYLGQVYEFQPTNDPPARQGSARSACRSSSTATTTNRAARLPAAARGRQLWVYLAHSRPANMIALKMIEPLPVKQWVHLTMTYDGSSRAAGTTFTSMARRLTWKSITTR